VTFSPMTISSSVDISSHPPQEASLQRSPPYPLVTSL